MSALTTGEVMEALKRLIRTAMADEKAAVRDFSYQRRPDGEAAMYRASADLLVLRLLEKYAPEMVQREAEEAAGERQVRVTFTAEEMRVGLKHSCGWVDPADLEDNRRFWDKLDAALKSINPPEILERSDREDGE